MCFLRFLDSVTFFNPKRVRHPPNSSEGSPWTQVTCPGSTSPPRTPRWSCATRSPGRNLIQELFLEPSPKNVKSRLCCGMTTQRKCNAFVACLPLALCQKFNCLWLRWKIRWFETVLSPKIQAKEPRRLRLPKQAPTTRPSSNPRATNAQTEAIMLTPDEAAW